MDNYFVYMILCADGSYYVGITNNVDRRVWEHGAGIDPGCYTYERRPVRLVYCAGFRDVIDAIAWEKHVKGWSRAKKRALANDDWKRIHDIVRAERHQREHRF
ncbi:MAG: GIY-YIG nuclease family protein [Candidatus Eremiobacteraeota bacterium]|nr:GIY-YIG nuclease family protein [Candidatus Eremiobacteraeota bacterium]